jgi:hypothetical protein
LKEKENAIKNASSGNSDDAGSIKTIIGLGDGPISEEALDRMVASGEVIDYEENGVQKFIKVPPKFSPVGLFSKYK